MKTMIHTQFKSGIRVLTVLLVLGFHFQASAQKQELPAEARAIPNFRALWANEPFSKYDPSNEIVEKRDQVSKHFRNADGTVTAHIASGPIHYWEEGQWKTIFHTILETPSNFTSTHNSFKTYYPKDVNSGLINTLSDGTLIIEMSDMGIYCEVKGQSVYYQEANFAATNAKFNEITYSKIYGEYVDLRFTQETVKRKMDYIIKSANFITNLPSESEFLIFEEKVILPENVQAKLVNNKILLERNDGVIIGTYDKPEVSDSRTEKVVGSKIKSRIEATYEIIQISNLLTIKLKIPFEWLGSIDRIFPIKVDPTYIPDNTARWTGNIITYSSGTPYPYNITDIYGTDDDYFYVGFDDDGWVYWYAYLAWAKFNTSTIPNNATVSSVQLDSYVDFDFASSISLSINPIVSDPVPSTNANLLTDIKNGTSYNDVVYNAAVNFSSSGWKTINLGGSSASDLQGLLSSDWFAVGYKPYYAANTDDYVGLRGYSHANKPFITVTYTAILVPTVTTTTAGSIGNFTASSGGNVTSDGGASVTARGVLWSTSPGLTMPSASSTSNGTATGSFTSSLTGLSASTVYYYRAYALNSVGYGYGTEYSFVTTGPSAEGYYISGNIVNNGEIVSTYDENYLRMTGTSKTITGSGIFTNSKLFADGSTTFNDNFNAASAFTETFVNAAKSLTIATGRTFKNGTMGNYGTLTIDGTGIINNTLNWVNGATGTVTFGASGTGTIYAGANWTNDGTFTAGNGTVEFNGSTNNNGINGTTTFYHATINKGSSIATILDVNGTVTQTNSAANLTFTNGLLRIPSGGSWTKTSGGPTIGAASGLHVNGGTFTLNGASITNNGIFKTTTGTATIGNISGNSITNQSGSSFILDGAGAVNIAGRLEATGTGSVNQSAGTINICTSGNSTTNVGSIDMASGTSFTMTGGAINMVQKSTGSTQIDYKNLAGTVSISGGTLTIGTAATTASSNFNIQGAMPPLVVDNTTNAKTATINGASTVYGNVTINSTSSLVLNSGITATVNGSLSNSGIYNATGTLNLAEDWTNNGTFTSNVGNTVVFNGGSASTISGSGTDNFQNLTITKTNSTPLLEVTLGKDATVLGTLTLTNGKLIVSGTKTLSIGNTSANGTISGGSSSSYIVAYKDLTTAAIGTLKRFVNLAAPTVYSLPIGDATSYTPMTFTLTSATLLNAYISVFTKAAKIASMNASVTNYLKRYWDLTPSGITGTVNYTVNYTYATGDINGVEDSFFPVKRSGTATYTWYKPTGTSFSTGTAEGTGSRDVTTNTLTWSGLSTFSEFSAAGNQVVNLPIDLLSFDAKKQNQNNLLFWSTATETNSDYFTIEKTLDGASYEVVGNVNGGGTSFDVLDYTLVDYDVRKAINYYRLKQTDTDGTEKISALVSVDNRENNGKAISMKTNLLGQEINENYRGIVIILFEDGTSIKIIQ